MLKNPPLTKEFVSGLLSYDADSGLLKWAVSRGSAKPGKIAGSVHTDGHGCKYIHIRVEGRLYKAHQLAWLLHYGEWPTFLIDHKDRDGTNNRIKNLRSADQSQNLANARRHKDNKTGVKGVYLERGSIYVVRIQCKKKSHLVGRFKDLEEAAAAYSRASRELFGEFARAE